MSALINNEVQKIQDILGKTQDVLPRDELSHYTAMEKCVAILNWKDETGSHLDTTLIESIQMQLASVGSLSKKQRQVLDNTLLGCSIDVSEYL